MVKLCVDPDVQWFFLGVVSRDGLGLGCIGAPGYRAHSSVATAPMFKGIKFGRHHVCMYQQSASNIFLLLVN